MRGWFGYICSHIVVTRANRAVEFKCIKVWAECKLISVFVISRSSDTTRRELIAKQLDKHGVAFTFFDAHDYKKPHEWIHLSKKPSHSPISNAEEAIFSSHYHVWKMIAKREGPALVLEDDLILNAHFFTIAKSEHLASFDYLKLASSRERTWRTMTTLPEGFAIEVFSGFRGPVGAQAYYLSPEGACKLLHNARSWTRTVDNYMDAYWRHRLPILRVFPECIESNTELKSTKEFSHNPQTRIGREFARIIEWLRFVPSWTKFTLTGSI